MTKKFHRFLSLAISLIMVLSMVSVNASAEEYTVDKEIILDTADAKLPELTNPALAWKGPEIIYNDAACGKEEHTHSTETCSYREIKDGEKADFSMMKYQYRTDDPNDPNAYIWVDCTLEEFNKAKVARGWGSYYVWTCGMEEHTHSDECREITGYKWTVVASNRIEHTIRNHIKVDFTNVQEGMSVSDVIVKATYANEDVVTLVKDGTDDYGGLIYNGIHNSNNSYAIISNDTDDERANRIVGVDITYTYNGETETYKVDSFAGLEAARLACPNNEWNSNGLDFTVKVGSTSKYYSRIVKNYYVNDELMGSESSDVIKSSRDSVTIKPEDTASYNGDNYSLDKNTGNYEKVDISDSENNPDKAVEIVINYRRTAASISYEFISGTDGKALPADVKSQQPEKTYLSMGSTATPSESTFDEVYEYVNGVKSGTWTFVGWDEDEVKDVSTDVKFTGTWKFTEEPKYKVVYKWKEGTDIPSGVELPDEDSYYGGESVTIADDPVTESNTKGDMQGTWEFLGWDTSELSDGKIPLKVKGTDTFTIVGEWNFTEADKHSYTITYIGNGGMIGNETSVKDSENVENVYSESVEMTVDNNTFTRDNFEFRGWAETLEDAAAGNVTVNPGDEITFTPEMTSKTLYAVWKQVESSESGDDGKDDTPSGKDTPGGKDTPSGKDTTSGKDTPVDESTPIEGNTPVEGNESTGGNTSVDENTSAETVSVTTASPVTGDSSNATLWIILMIAGLGCAAWVIEAGKKFKR